MKSLMLLWQVVAYELGDICGVSTTHDYNTIVRRVKHEGFSFLAITLPSFCKEFERALADGFVGDATFSSFRRRGGLPQFLGGFLRLVFDPGCGRLVDSPSSDAIYAIRQLTLLFGKVEVPASEKRYRDALRGFIDCEQEVKNADNSRSDEAYAKFRRAAILVWGDVLQEVENRLYWEQRYAGGQEDPDWPYVIPQHGPGSTADRRFGNEKFDQFEWTDRLEAVFPYVEYALPNVRYFKRTCCVNFLEPGSERPVKVIRVPKTLKTPRLIAIEPSYMQYMQQGVKELLVKAIGEDSFLGGVVGFDDQPVNRRMAKEGSLTGNLATLDLSEASDRVSNQLVRTLLSQWPHVAEAVDATRSRRADVPGEGIISLHKFASMGSALTFPVEAMVFTTVVFMGISDALNLPLTRRVISALRDRVRVYGDDIIVPTDCALSVVSALESYGFKVNLAKSFWEGHFRESCGREYFNGIDVSVVKVRHIVHHDDGSLELPTRRKYAREIVSLVALRNNFYVAGLWRTTQWLDDRLEVLFRGFYPFVPFLPGAPEEDASGLSSVLGRWSFLGYRTEWTHPTLHCPLVRGYRAISRLPNSDMTGVGALLKVLSPGRLEPFEDRFHLERAGRPESTRLKLRWDPPLV